jgi:transcriptional regulator with XRE-family HTH domain
MIMPSDENMPAREPAEIRPLEARDLDEWYFDALHAALSSLRSVFQRLRTEDGMTQEAIARRSGVKKSAISRVFRGRTNPTLKTLNAIARGMGCRVEIRFKSLKDLATPNQSFELSSPQWREQEPGTGSSGFMGVLSHSANHVPNVAMFQANRIVLHDT